MKINCDDLPGHLADICRGTYRKQDGGRYTLRDRQTIVGLHLRLPPSEAELPVVPASGKPLPANVSNIGDKLHKIIEAKTGTVPCSDCRATIYSLNQLTAEEVLAKKHDLAAQIVKRAKTKAKKWWQRWGATLAPGLAIKVVLDWIEEACNSEDNPASMTWSYGVTTIPERAGTTLPRTLHSLAAAGFDSPRLFIDEAGTTGSPRAQIIAEQFPALSATVRSPRIRTFGNWALGLAELYIRNPDADRYAMFQDDLVAYRNLRQYLEWSPMPPNCYLNLYTVPMNEKTGRGYKGWYPSNQLGLGALALVFSNEAAVTLLTAFSFVMKPKYKPPRPGDTDRSWKSVDGGIVHAMKNAKYREFVHLPSLVTHIGRNDSSMGNRQGALPTSFRGPEYDAMDLCSEVSPPRAVS